MSKKRDLSRNTEATSEKIINQLHLDDIGYILPKELQPFILDMEVPERKHWRRKIGDESTDEREVRLSNESTKSNDESIEHPLDLFFKKNKDFIKPNKDLYKQKSEAVKRFEDDDEFISKLVNKLKEEVSLKNDSKEFELLKLQKEILQLRKDIFTMNSKKNEFQVNDTAFNLSPYAKIV